jgi:hypothetical protein
MVVWSRLALPALGVNKSLEPSGETRFVGMVKLCREAGAYSGIGGAKSIETMEIVLSRKVTSRVT